MNLEEFKNTIKRLHDLVKFDYILEGYGFKNEKELFKENWLPKDFMQELKKNLADSKKDIKEVCDFIEEKLTQNQAEEVLTLISPHQYKFGQFKANHSLPINIFAELTYIRNMKVFSEELFFPNELVILKKIQAKANIDIIRTMTHEEVLLQYEKISNIINPNPTVTLMSRENNKSKNRKKKI